MLRRSLTAAVAVLLLSVARGMLAAPAGVFPIDTENLNTHVGRQQLAFQLPYLIEELGQQFETVVSCPPEGCSYLTNEDLYAAGILNPPQWEARVVVEHYESEPRLRIQLRYMNLDVCNMFIAPGGPLSKHPQWEWFIEVAEQRDQDGNVIKGSYLTRTCVNSPLNLFGPFLKEMPGFNHLTIYPFPPNRIFVSERPLVEEEATPPVSESHEFEMPPASCSYREKLSGQTSCGVFGRYLAIVDLCDESPTSAECQAARKCQQDAVQAISRLEPGSAPLQPSEYSLLMEGLLGPGPEPGSGKKLAERAYSPTVQSAAAHLYTMSAGTAIDEPFRVQEAPRYQRVVDSLAGMVPDAEIWSASTDFQRETHLKLAAGKFALEFGMNTPTVDAVSAMDKCKQLTGFWEKAKCWNDNLVRGYFGAFLGQGEGRLITHNKDGPKIEVDDIGIMGQEKVYRTLFEELIHARQWQLAVDQGNCSLSETDPANHAATVFAANKLLYADFASSEIGYRNQPMEHWAKEYAQLMVGRLDPMSSVSIAECVAAVRKEEGGCGYIKAAAHFHQQCANDPDGLSCDFAKRCQAKAFQELNSKKVSEWHGNVQEHPSLAGISFAEKKSLSELIFIGPGNAPDARSELAKLYLESPARFIPQAYRRTESTMLKQWIQSVAIPNEVTWNAIGAWAKWRYLESFLEQFKEYFGYSGITLMPVVTGPSGLAIKGHILRELSIFGTNSEGSMQPLAQDFQEAPLIIRLHDWHVATRGQIYRTLLEELIHVRTYKLLQQQYNCGMASSSSSASYDMASILGLNWQNYFKPPRDDVAVYNAQPSEYWAKEQTDVLIDIIAF
jgi:hypothetical protein